MTIADALAETTVAGLDLSRYVAVAPDTTVAATSFRQIAGYVEASLDAASG